MAAGGRLTGRSFLPRPPSDLPLLIKLATVGSWHLDALLGLLGGFSRLPDGFCYLLRINFHFSTLLRVWLRVFSFPFGDAQLSWESCNGFAITLEGKVALAKTSIAGPVFFDYLKANVRFSLALKFTDFTLKAVNRNHRSLFPQVGQSDLPSLSAPLIRNGPVGIAVS